MEAIMAAERCEVCDHLMTLHAEKGGCQKAVIVPSLGAYVCPCIVKPRPPLCKAQEGATGIACSLNAGHSSDHEGTHIPRTDGTDGIGYQLFVRWPYTSWDLEADIKPDLK
jgi:hypothetical protein